MDTKYYSDNIFKKTLQNSAQHIGIGILILIISIGLAGKVSAAYLLSDFARAATYIDKEWYYFLDQGQYQYLDRGQYHLIGELGYFLGHPFYPKMYEKDISQKITFANTINKGWFIFFDQQFPLDENNLGSRILLNTRESIDRQNYNFSDKGLYYYLDKRQYNLFDGPAYSFKQPYYGKQFSAGIQTSNVITNPEPSTIVFLGLGAIAVIVLRKKNRKTTGT